MTRRLFGQPTSVSSSRVQLMQLAAHEVRRAAIGDRSHFSHWRARLRTASRSAPAGSSASSRSRLASSVRRLCKLSVALIRRRRDVITATPFRRSRAGTISRRGNSICLSDGLLEKTMSGDGASSQSRFFIRMGGLGWMVYDRERRGPALIDTELVANLTREQAERALGRLILGADAGRRPSRTHP
jgi:hypothetical protein